MENDSLPLVPASFRYYSECFDQHGRRQCVDKMMSALVIALVQFGSDKSKQSREYRYPFRSRLCFLGRTNRLGTTSPGGGISLIDYSVGSRPGSGVCDVFVENIRLRWSLTRVVASLSKLELLPRHRGRRISPP